MRGYFAFELYKQMKLNPKIWLLTGDLGYAMFDYIREDFPDRFINCGAAEQAMMDIACGLAIEGKIPFVYSITTFLLYRPFETIRTYINHEKLNVKLIASGRDKDYTHDGISHWSEDAKNILTCLPNVRPYWPEDKSEVPEIMQKVLTSNLPDFISLRR
jgi:transketolase